MPINVTDLYHTIRKQLRIALGSNVRARFADETDATFTLGTPVSAAALSPRDRLPADRLQPLDQSLEAWRANPLARRIVELTTEYVVGSGLRVQCAHEPTQRFLQKFWQHPLNRMDVRVSEWCDELSRSGNLFLLLSTDAAGMSYLRAVPAGEISEITSRPNDLEQPLHFHPRATLEDLHPAGWPAWQPELDLPDARGTFRPVMLHYAVNRPVGAQWGESDLAPLLKWLSRYANWLEDRARLNRFRTSFLYVVKARFSSEADRLTRQQRLNAAPPSPGSILVTDDNESWDVINPRLASEEANTDGLALKKMIAAGAGVPLHFLAEPESATRTTAEAAGGPTYRRFEQRQAFFLWLIRDVLRVVISRRAQLDRTVSRRADVEVFGADLSARDNVALAMAANQTLSVLTELRDRSLIDDRELLRLVYRFLGESTDVGEMLARGKKDLLTIIPAAPAKRAASLPLPRVDLLTGEAASTAA